jgi:4-amino-4-deoxy-L-arabinose transferase-like glycosyltransferase
LQRLTLAKRAWLLLFAGICVVYFYGLGELPLVGPDEPRYAQVAREMFERGDWITPTLNGQTWFEKPALLYWLMMISYATFGVSEWAARFAPACAGVLTVLVVGWAARRAEFASGVEMRGFGYVAAAVTATCAGLMVFSRAASFDIILTATVALALACFFMSELESDARKRRWLAVGFYVGIGLSLLAKGLVGVVLPLDVVVAYAMLRRRATRGVRAATLVWGTVVALAVAATWYAPVLARHGWSFVDEFFVQHHFARYVSNKYKHPQPFYFYVPIAALLALPWTAFLVAGVGSAWRANWRAEDAASKLRVFALVWLVVPVAFFSLSASKLPGYILPALPGAALLAGERLARYVRGEGGVGAMRATGVLVLAGACGTVYAIMSGMATLACGLAIGVPVVLAGTVALLWSQMRGLCAGLIVATAFVVVLLITVCGLERVGGRESVRELFARAAARGYTSAPVFQLHTVERTAEFYAARRLAYDEQGEPLKFEGAFQVAERAQAHQGAVLVLVPVKWVSQLTEEPSLQTEVIADNGRLALVAAQTKQR